MPHSHPPASNPGTPAVERSVGPILPSYLVGQDRQGRWVALESQGRGGGYFRSREAAFHYAVNETGRRAGAVRLSAEPLGIVL